MKCVICIVIVDHNRLIFFFSFYSGNEWDRFGSNCLGGVRDDRRRKSRERSRRQFHVDSAHI